jgi:hypothetical protein
MARFGVFVDWYVGFCRMCSAWSVSHDSDVFTLFFVFGGILNGKADYSKMIGDIVINRHNVKPMNDINCV